MPSSSQPSLDFGWSGDPDDTFTVGQLNAAISDVLGRAFRDEVWVRGEIESYSRSAAGHAFFTLVERGPEGEHTLRVALFAKARMAVEGYLARQRMRLENGIEVRVCGQLEFYAARGQINLRMTGIDPTYTIGRLAQDRDRLLRRLVAEGLLDLQKRWALPAAPLRVGLVTSRSGAAFHDFVDELARSGFGFELIVADTRVQGTGADRMIAAAIELVAARGVEVIAVVRGGGSRTDLASFDAEVIARAIAAAPVPVITGVGHEIDTSVADLVAHASYKTPTACAGALVSLVRDFTGAAEAAWSGIAARAVTQLDAAHWTLEGRARTLAKDAAAAIAASQVLLSHHGARARREAALAVAGGAQRLDRAVDRLQRVTPRQLGDADATVAVLAARTSALDPVRTLARGYSITRRADGTVVRSAASVPVGEQLTTSVADGVVHSTVVAVAVAVEPGSPTNPTEKDATP